MSLQTQAFSTISQVPSTEGLPIDLEVAVLYRVDPHKVVEIYKMQCIELFRVKCHSSEPHFYLTTE